MFQQCNENLKTPMVDVCSLLKQPVMIEDVQRSVIAFAQIAQPSKTCRMIRQAMVLALKIFGFE